MIIFGLVMSAMIIGFVCIGRGIVDCGKTIGKGIVGLFSKDK